MMRWVKHLTATRQDEKISRLIAAHGLAGYGLWWAVVEIVAAHVEKSRKPSVTYPVSTWSHLLSLRGSHVRQAILKLEVTGLVTAEWAGTDLTVTIPNLLKYRDEYSKKSGHSPDNVGTLIQKQNTEAETEKEKQKILPLVVPPEEPMRPEFDEQFQEFKREYLRSGKPLIERDFSEAWYPWKILDFGQRKAAIAGVKSRIDNHEWDDPRFIKRPSNFLTDREFERALLPPRKRLQKQWEPGDDLPRLADGRVDYSQLPGHMNPALRA
jgi:hypothetical protein